MSDYKELEAQARKEAACLDVELPEPDGFDPTHGGDFMRNLADAIADLRARLAEAEQSAERWHKVTHDICEEWTEDCDPACDRYAHADNCKAASIAEAKRALTIERDTLRRDNERLTEENARLKADAERFDWYFGPDDKGAWINEYLRGVGKNWTRDEWRASIDKARAALGAAIKAREGK